MHPNKYFEKLDVHDGTQSDVPEVDRAEATKIFISLVEDAMMDNTGEVKFDFMYDLSYTMTLQINEIDSLFVMYGVNDKERDETESPASRSLVMAIDIVKQVQNRAKQFVSYGLGTDGVVRRYFDPRYDRTMQQGLATFTTRLLSLPGAVHAALEIDEVMNADLPVSEVEEYLGYQHQPVSLDETKRLAELLSVEPVDR